MQLNVGDVLEGKVTSITKFGAFIALPDGRNGLVHISEIANAFVNDIHEHLSEGQSVKVKVIGINEAGKINLSIKQAEERPPQQRSESFRPRPQMARAQFSPKQSSDAAAAPQEQSFEDKLKHFMQDSDSRISDSRIYSDRKGGYKRRRD